MYRQEMDIYDPNLSLPPFPAYSTQEDSLSMSALKVFKVAGTLIPTAPPLGYLWAMNEYFKRDVFICQDCGKSKKGPNGAQVSKPARKIEKHVE